MSGIIGDPSRPIAARQREAGEELVGAGVEHGDVVVILDIDEHVALAIGGAELKRAPDGDGGDHLRGDGVDHANVAAVGVHHPQRAGKGVEGDVVGLFADRDDRADGASAAVEDGGRVGTAIGRDDLTRAWDGESGVTALGGDQRRGQLTGVEIDRLDRFAPRDIEAV